MREKKLSSRQHLQGSLRDQTHFKGNSEEGRLPLYEEKPKEEEETSEFPRSEMNTEEGWWKAQEGREGDQEKIKELRAQKGRVFRGPYIYLNHVWLSLGACLQKPYHNAHTVSVPGSLVVQDRSAASRNPMQI